MSDKPRELSISNLQRLYAIVVSLAIAESLRRLLSDYGDNGQLPEFASMVAVFSLLITVIPYFHGANRYLEATYITGESKVKSQTLMLDFVALFVEGLIFFILAVVIEKTQVFFTILAALFVYSSVWISFRYLSTSRGNKIPFVLSWPIANLTAATLLLIIVWPGLLRWSLGLSSTAMNVGLGATALLRTVYDYYSSWDFYVPSGKMTDSVPSRRPQRRK